MASPSAGNPRVRASLPFGAVGPLVEDVMPFFHEKKVPRYLFRLHAPETGVKTTESEVIPPAGTLDVAEKPEDIFMLARGEAADILNRHLRWENLDMEERNLTSWTSSLLVALQHGLYRHKKDHSNPRLDQIFLLILDTRQFPKGTFIKDMEIAKFFSPHADPTDDRNLGDHIKLRERDDGKYYFGEYLSQGWLDTEGACAQTSLQKMIDLGLFQLHSDLDDTDEWPPRWAKRVVELRQPLRFPPEEPLTTRADVRRAIIIAQGCFGDRWAIPVSAMLLGLEPRKSNDPVITDGFAAMFSSAEIDALSLDGIKIYADKLPEVDQFRILIGDIYRRFGERDVDQVANTFGSFSIG